MAISAPQTLMCEEIEGKNFGRFGYLVERELARGPHS